MSLSARITKLMFITQNNHVYEYTAEGPTPEVLLNIRSPYRRQKRDFSIIRSSFRRSLYTGIEIFAINTTTFLPITSTIFYLLAIISITFYLSTFLPSYDHIDYSLISYLPTFLRPYRLSNNLYSLSQSKPRWIYHAQA
jgi:hypothetical protein